VDLSGVELVLWPEEDSAGSCAPKVVEAVVAEVVQAQKPRRSSVHLKRMKQRERVATRVQKISRRPLLENMGHNTIFTSSQTATLRFLLKAGLEKALKLGLTSRIKEDHGECDEQK
jgi:hypothetical protein